MAERLLTIDNLDVSFGQGENRSDAVRSVNVTIDRGQTVALVGESGSGKSVTALSVMQLLPYPFAQHPSGSVKPYGLAFWNYWSSSVFVTQNLESKPTRTSYLAANGNAL